MHKNFTLSKIEVRRILFLCNLPDQIMNAPESLTNRNNIVAL